MAASDKVKTEPESDQAFADIIEAYANAETEKTLVLSTGRTVRIRMPNSVSEIQNIQSEARKYSQMFGGELPLPPRLAKYKHLSPHVQLLCVLCSQMVFEPALKLVQWLELSERAGKFLLEVGVPVAEAFAGLDALHTQSEVNEEKNG